MVIRIYSKRYISRIVKTTDNLERKEYILAICPYVGKLYKYID
jgi:hypothetical protein